MKQSAGNRALAFLKSHIMYVVLVVLIAFFATQSNRFLTVTNMTNIVNQSSYYIIVGVGIALIMLSGGMDLSVGYQMSLIGVVMGSLLTEHGLSIPLVMLVGVLMGCAMSLLNGILYVKLNVFPFVLTLATQYVFYGLSYSFSGSQTYTSFPAAFKVIGQGSLGPIPLPIIIMIVIVAIGSFILNRTYFGRYIYGLGSNAEAVKLAGVKGNKVRLAVYALAGLFTAIGTIVYISRTGSASSTMGPGTEFTLITAALLGGIRMGGGGGKMSSIVIGVLILTVIQNGMQMMQMDTFQQYVVKGIVLAIALWLDSAQAKRIVRQSKQVAGQAPADIDTPTEPEHKTK